MKTKWKKLGHRAALMATGTLAGLFMVAGAATAADHALIMGIGNYSDPSANLPGIDKDIQAAKRIAASIGVPAANMRVLADSQLSSKGIASAMQEMESRITRGDRVFVYYSGHGGQRPAENGARCTEGIVAFELNLFRDTDLEAALANLSGKAGQLIMFNDSCFSGGAATKSAARGGGAVAKYFPIKAVADNSGYSCGHAVNMKTAARSLVASATAKGNNFVYIAAAADDEVAFATPNGSSATLAWESCLKSSSTDTNGSGSLSASELAACAQQQLRANNFNQTITLEGNKNLPLSFAAAAPNPAPVAAAEAARRSAATLEDIRQAASSAIQVELLLAKNDLKIDQDPLDFSVRTSRAGYLYVLHVGTDGKTFDLLFPNQFDQNNFVQPGTMRLPRPSWRVVASGPTGDSYVLALLSETQRDFTKPLANKIGPFASAEMNPQSQEKLRVEATGVGGSGGTAPFGASTVARVREHN